MAGKQYIYRALASQRLSVNVPIGTRLPNHTNALGRALLSQKTPKELSQLYIGKQLDNHPPPHPQNLLELVELIQIEQNQGYAISRSDNATAIAAPLFNYAGEIVAAINASGPDVVMKDKVVNHGIMEQLLKTAAKISMELGYRA